MTCTAHTDMFMFYVKPGTATPVIYSQKRIEPLLRVCLQNSISCFT